MTGGTVPSTVSSENEPQQKPSRIGVGMPSGLALDHFGRLIFDAYGWMPYHVGSSLRGKEWRDVDVRVILDDEEWAAEFGGPPGHFTHDPKWVVLCWSLSLLGREMTGLPIDFQIQPMRYANERWTPPEHCRSAIGIGWLRERRS